MAVIATVLYPQSSSTKFDMDYYLSSHMPLVEKTWKSQGLTKWEVVHAAKQAHPLDGSDQQFGVQAILTWESAEHCKKAMTGESAGPVFGDIPNFTNESPTLVMGEVVGSN